MIKNLRKKGFTIVELVIVIAVIAILAAILIPTFSSVVSKANAAKIQAELKNGYTLYLAGVSDDKEYDPKLELVFEYSDDKNNISYYLYDGSVFISVGTAKPVGAELASYNTEEKFSNNIWGATGKEAVKTEGVWLEGSGSELYKTNVYDLGNPVSFKGDYIFKYAIFDNVTVYKVE